MNDFFIYRVQVDALFTAGRAWTDVGIASTVANAIRVGQHDGRKFRVIDQNGDVAVQYDPNIGIDAPWRRT